MKKLANGFNGYVINKRETVEKVIDNMKCCDVENFDNQILQNKTYHSIYKEIFKNEHIFDEFCNALKEKQVKSLKDEFKDIGAGEILSEIGLEMIMDTIPYLRTGKKIFNLIKKK